MTRVTDGLSSLRKVKFFKTPEIRTTIYEFPLPVISLACRLGRKYPSASSFAIAPCKGRRPYLWRSLGVIRSQANNLRTTYTERTARAPLNRERRRKRRKSANNGHVSLESTCVDRNRSGAQVESVKNLRQSSHWYARDFGHLDTSGRNYLNCRPHMVWRPGFRPPDQHWSTRVGGRRYTLHRNGKFNLSSVV